MQRPEGRPGGAGCRSAAHPTTQRAPPQATASDLCGEFQFRPRHAPAKCPAPRCMSTGLASSTLLHQDASVESWSERTERGPSRLPPETNPPTGPARLGRWHALGVAIPGLLPGIHCHCPLLVALQCSQPQELHTHPVTVLNVLHVSLSHLF